MLRRAAPALATMLVSACLQVLVARPAMAAPAGSLDPSFGDTGVVTTAAAGTSSAMAVSPDDSITLGSLVLINGNPGVALLRFNSDGGMVESFGSQGAVYLQFNAYTTVRTMVTTPDGSVVFAGSTETSGGPLHWYVAKVDPSGDLDSSFGVGGLVEIPANDAGEIWDMTTQSDGSLIVAGNMHTGIASHLVVARLTPGGALDPTFGSAGTLDTGVLSDFTTSAVAPDDRIFVSSSQQGIVAVTADGDIDTGFGTSGLAAYPDPTFASHTLVVTADGDVLDGGTIYNGDVIFAATRFSGSGDVEEGWGDNGTSSIPSLGNISAPEHLDEMADGSVLASGTGYTNFQRRFVLVRFLSDGTLDGSFGTNGIAWPVTSAGGWWASGGGRLADGRLVLAGTFDPSSGPNETAVIRLFTTDAPTATLTDVPDGLVNDTTQSFSFSADDPNATFRCSLDGAAGQLCSSPYEWDNLSNGAHTFAVRAVDIVGNVGPADQTSFEVNTDIPDHQPDCSIRSGTRATGAGVIDAGGLSERLLRRIEPGGSVSFRVKVENVGVLQDEYRLSASGSGNALDVTYLVDGADVTDQIVDHFTTSSLERLEFETVRMRIQVATDAPVGRERSFRLLARSAADPGSADAVVAVIRVVRAPAA